MGRAKVKFNAFTQEFVTNDPSHSTQSTEVQVGDGQVTASAADVAASTQDKNKGTDTSYLLDGYGVLRQWSFDSSKSWIRRRQADVHQDELCPPNKRYALMDAKKKIDLDNPLCPNESKIMANILQNHPLRFSIVASSSVPWIYLGQLWHTLKEDGSKYRLTFVLDIKELTMTLDDFRMIF
ncbi:hypothetical protein Tco_1368094 [Tanacetum coccineum]